MSRFEYRVRWEREGGGRVITRIYQTEQAALHKIHGILALEEIKDRTERWASLPDLDEGPDLEMREVGEWEPSGRSIPTRANESARAGVANWAGIYDTPSGDRMPAPDADEIPF